MKIENRTTFEVGLYAVNCTILTVNDKAWIVDPGSEALFLAAQLTKMKLSPAGILLTHAHFDHIGAVNELQRRYGAIPVYVGENDIPVLTHPFNQLPPDYPAIEKPENLHGLKDGDFVPELDGARVLATPGHTPGGVCYHFPEDKLLVSGDTLFAGSVGRTDFPGGDMGTLMNSLEKLKALEDDTLVIPGHGPTTTIGEEKSANPFLLR